MGALLSGREWQCAPAVFASKKIFHASGSGPGPNSLAPAARIGSFALPTPTKERFTNISILFNQYIDIPAVRSPTHSDCSHAGAITQQPQKSWPRKQRGVPPALPRAAVTQPRRVA